MQEPPAANGAGPATDATAQADYDAFVRKNLPRNYAGHFVHGMLGMTGFRLISTPTFVPAYIHSVSGSDIWVGVATSLQQLGAIISPIFGAAHLEHRPRMLRMAALFGGLMRVQLLALALTAWFLTGVPALMATLLFLFLFGFFLGPQRVAFQVLLAKVIPISLRGRLQALRNLVGGIVAAAVSYVAGSWLVASNVFGNGYGTTFFVAFVLTTLGLIAIEVILREPAAIDVKERQQVRQRFRQLPQMVRADSGFAWFIVARSLAMGGRIALPFIFIYATTELGASPAEDQARFGALLALLSFVYMGADTAANLLWGYLSDRSGFRATFIGATIINIAGIALLLASSSFMPLAIAFVAIGASQSGYIMAASNIVIEFGTPEDVSMRMALTNTAEGAMGAVAPLLGAGLIAVGGYEVNFIATLVCLGLALALALFKVDEPRRRTPAGH